MQWLRLYHDTITDHKWRVVANESRQPEANVLAVWMHMMINASESSVRGTLEGWNDRITAAALGIPTDAVTAIREAMQGLVLDGMMLTGWDKRQRESDTSAERTRRYRAKNAGGDGGDGGGAAQRANGAYNRHSDGNVTSHSEPVTSHKAEVTSQPLRAQTPDSDSEDSEAHASGAGAPRGQVVSHPATAQGELFGQVLADMVIAAPEVPPRDIRSQFGKALGNLGPDAALTLARQALNRAEPWSYFCKTLNERIKAAGGRPGKPLEKGAADFLELFEQRMGGLS